MTKLGTGRPMFDSRQGQRSFLYSTASKSVLGLIRVPIQWLKGGSFLGSKIAQVWSWSFTFI